MGKLQVSRVSHQRKKIPISKLNHILAKTDPNELWRDAKVAQRCGRGFFFSFRRQPQYFMGVYHRIIKSGPTVAK